MWEPPGNCARQEVLNHRTLCRTRPASSTATQGRSQSLRNTDCLRIGGTPSELDTSQNCKSQGRHVTLFSHFLESTTRVPVHIWGPTPPKQHARAHLRANPAGAKRPRHPVRHPTEVPANAYEACLTKWHLSPKQDSRQATDGEEISRREERGKECFAISTIQAVRNPDTRRHGFFHRHGKRQPPGWKEHRLTARNVRPSDPLHGQPSLNPRENQT